MKRIGVALVVLSTALVLAAAVPGHSGPPSSRSGTRLTVTPAGHGLALGYTASHVNLGSRFLWRLRCTADAIGGTARTTRVISRTMQTDRGETISANGGTYPGNHAETSAIGVTRPAGIAFVCVKGATTFADGTTLAAHWCF